MLNRPNVQAIIFDGEGVVFDTEPLWDEAQKLLLERRGVRYDRARVKHLIAGRGVLEGILVLQREFHLDGDPDALAAERNADIRRLIAERVEFIPGFQEFFERVRARYKTCVATSMPRALLALAETRLGVTALFGDRIFSIEDVGNRSKPDPAVFVYAAQRLATPPDRCLVIEDAPNGIEAATRAGMRCFALTTTFPKELLSGADETASSYEEVARLLEPMGVLA
jgi:beta-phosphoglucomutase